MFIPNFITIVLKTSKVTRGLQRLLKVTEGHQLSIFVYGQICILEIILHTKFSLIWSKNKENIAGSICNK